MVKVELPYVQEVRKEGGRKGRRVLRYYRRAGRQWGSLPGEPSSPEFLKAYQALHELAERELKAEAEHAKESDGPPPGSFSRLVWAYKRSPEYQELAEKTRKEYALFLTRLDKRFGDLQVAGLNKPKDPTKPWKGRIAVQKYRDELAATPYMANMAITVLRLVLNYGIEIGMLHDNPAARPRRLKVQRRQAVWSTEAMKEWLAAVPQAIDNEDLQRAMRLAFFLLAYTAQRPTDVLKFHRDHYRQVEVRTRSGRRRKIWIMACRQQKTSRLVWVPVHPTLKRELDAAPKRGLLWLLSAEGRAFKYRYFCELWDKVSQKAELRGLRRQDLRRTGMVHMAEGGATPQQVSAVSGHTIETTTEILETYIPRNLLMAVEAIDLTTLDLSDSSKAG